MSSSLFKYFSYTKCLRCFSDLFQKQLKNILLGIFFCFSTQAYSNVIDLKKIFSSQSVESIQRAIEAGELSVGTQDEFGRTLLHYAVELGDVELVEFLIEEGADVNAQDEEGNTALHYAIFELNTRPLYYPSNNKFFKIVEVLKDAGADASLQNDEGETPLTYVVFIASEETVRRITEVLKKEEVDGDFQNEVRENTALDIAEVSNDEEEVHVDTQGQLKVGKGKALDIANVSNDEEEVHVDTQGQLKVGKGKTFDIANVSNDEEEVHVDTQDQAEVMRATTDLHIAVRSNDEKRVVSLIAEGFDLDFEDNEGNTALLIAAAIGLERIVEILIEAGADINFQNEFTGNTALHFAVAGRDEEVVDLLIQKRIDLDARNSEGKTAFLIAAERGLGSMMNKLIDSGADGYTQDNLGRTALHLVMATERFFTSITKQEAVEILVERVVDIIDIQDNEGRTALHYAIAFGYEDIAMYLIDSRADGGIQDINGRTALHEALLAFRLHFFYKTGAFLSDPNNAIPAIKFRRVSEEFVMYLIQNGGVDVNAEDSEGRTALYYAVTGFYIRGIVDLLIAYGSDIDNLDDLGQTPLLALVLQCQTNLEILEELVSLLNRSVSHIRFLNQGTNVPGRMSGREISEAYFRIIQPISDDFIKTHAYHLVKAGADTSLQDIERRTPQSVFRECYGEELVVR